MENLITAYTKMSNRFSNLKADLQDALQIAVTELMETEFDSVKDAEIALKSRVKSRVYDIYRHNGLVNDKAMTLKNYVLDSTSGTVEFKANKQKYTACLTCKQAEILELLLNGFKQSEICELLKIKKAALSRMVSRVIEILQAENCIELFQMDKFHTGNMAYNEDFIIYCMDNEIDTDTDYEMVI